MLFTFALLIAVLFALWNAFTIKWKLTGNQLWSKWWHGLGFIIRAIPLLLIYPNWLWMLIYANVAWILYDEIINIVNGWRLGYIGSTAATDRMLGKAAYLIKAVLAIGTVLYLVK